VLFQTPDFGFVCAENQQAVFRNATRKGTKGFPVVVHRSVDIRVIELDTGHDACCGAIVQEFGSFVEVRGVVFVPFDDEMRSGPDGIAHITVVHHATHQKARVTPCCPENMGQQAGCGGFSVGTRDDQGASILDEKMGDRL